MGVANQDLFETGSQECQKMQNSCTARVNTKVSARTSASHGDWTDRITWNKSDMFWDKL